MQRRRDDRRNSRSRLQPEINSGSLRTPPKCRRNFVQVAKNMARRGSKSCRHGPADTSRHAAINEGGNKSSGITGHTCARCTDVRWARKSVSRTTITRAPSDGPPHRGGKFLRNCISQRDNTRDSSVPGYPKCLQKASTGNTGRLKGGDAIGCGIFMNQEKISCTPNVVTRTI